MPHLPRLVVGGDHEGCLSPAACPFGKGICLIWGFVTVHSYICVVLIWWKRFPCSIPYYAAPPLTNLGEWGKTDSCIRAHNALVSRAKLVWSGDETKQTSKQHTNACAQCSDASVGLTLACLKHQNNLKSCLSPLIPHMVSLCKLTMWLKLKWTVSNKPYYCKQ